MIDQQIEKHHFQEDGNTNSFVQVAQLKLYIGCIYIQPSESIRVIFSCNYCCLNSLEFPEWKESANINVDLTKYLWSLSE